MNSTFTRCNLVSHKKDQLAFQRVKSCLLQASVAALFFAQSATAQGTCTPPTGSLGSGQNICTGFSPSVYTGDLTPVANSRYRIIAQLVSGNVSGFTALQTGIGADTDIEPNNLSTYSSGIVRYTAIPYGFGANGVDDGGLADDCVSSATSFVDVMVTTCQPSCIGTRAFSNYRNSTPANGTTTANFINNDGSNQVIVSSANTSAFASSYPNWLVDATGIRIARSGGVGSTKFSFATPTSEFTFNISGVQSTSSGIATDYLEQVRVKGKDAYGLPVMGQFYNLQEGAEIVNGNEIRDKDGGLQASASVYFNEPVKDVEIEQIGSQDDIFIMLAGCSFPSDYGDLTAGIWPVASAIVPGVLNSNVPDAYNAVSRPGVVVWAGDKVSTEPFTTGGGNNAASFDAEDDGLTPPLMPISSGVPSTFLVHLNANAANVKVYYRMWFDWNSDGNFSNDMDGNGQRATYAGSAMVEGAKKSIPVSINPSFNALANYKVRLAVSNDTIPDVYENSASFILNLNNGEIEDYQTLIVLPVQLLQFSAQKQGATSMLKWRVAEEVNVNHYDVEYSANAIAFSTVGVLAATGGPSYSFIHNPITRTNAGYYRLKSVDKDGRINYSPIRSLNWDGSLNLVVAPNPVKTNLQIRADNYNDNQDLLVRIMDPMGRVMMTKNIMSAVTNVDVSTWANGMYTVQVSDGTKVLSSHKVIKN